MPWWEGTGATGARKHGMEARVLPGGHGGNIYLRCRAAGFIAKDRRVPWEASSGAQRSAMGSKLQALSEGLSTDEFRMLFSPRKTG